MTPLLWQSRRLGMATCLQALLWITAAVLLSLAVLALVRRDGRSVNAVLAPALSVQISTTTTTSKTSSSRSSGQHASSKGTIIAEHRPDIVIPNLVHFVYLLDETAVTDESRLPLTFRHWLAVYAAHRRLQPDRILLWTNVDVHVLRRNHMGAQRSSTDSDVDSDVDSDIIDWAVRILAIPGVELRHTTAPTHVHTTTNHPLPIRFPENRSDFVRTRIMHEHGGIYLDFDAYILRDVHALRKSGFATVVGRQMDGRVGCGMFLGRAGTRLSRAYSELQDEAYDGRWDTHAVTLLDRLVNSADVVGDEGVLLLDQSAFFPYGWREKDMLALYGDDGIVMDNTTATSSTSTSTSTSPSTEQQLTTTDGIRLSPSSRHGSPLASAYAIHGWNAVHRRLSNAGKLPPLDMHYILGRRSAFARAMYPLVRDAILHGLIMETESERVAK